MTAPTNLDRSAGVFEEIDAPAWRAGTELALELFREADVDEMCLHHEYRDGRPQDNIVWRFLCEAREAGDPQIERAFCAVLTDLLVSAVEGGPTDALVEEWTRSLPVPQAVRA